MGGTGNVVLSGVLERSSPFEPGCMETERHAVLCPGWVLFSPGLLTLHRSSSQIGHYSNKDDGGVRDPLSPVCGYLK